MRRVTYSMGVSLDGDIHGPAGDLDWPGNSQQVFGAITDSIRELVVHVRHIGRRGGLAARPGIPGPHPDATELDPVGVSVAAGSPSPAP